MPKEAKKKSADEKPPKKEPADAPDRRPIKSFIKAVTLLAFIAGSIIGYLVTRNHVAKDLTFRKQPPKVILKDRPAWMTEALANRIVAVASPEVAHSAFDHQLLVNTAALLKSHPDTSPWIKSIRSVRRIFDRGPGDVMEIDCDFRAPVALVKWELYFWMVDSEGHLLPEQFSTAEVKRVMYDSSRRIQLRVIEGVASAPSESGQKWPGADLAAGIDLVKTLHGKPQADEVERVNVANFGGRLDAKHPQLVLFTKYNTQVWWGRPVKANDFNIEVEPAVKLMYMEKIVQQFGRVDARHSWIDLRFDRVMYPSEEAEANLSGGRQ